MNRYLSFSALLFFFLSSCTPGLMRDGPDEPYKSPFDSDDDYGRPAVRPYDSDDARTPAASPFESPGGISKNRISFSGGLQTYILFLGPAWEYVRVPTGEKLRDYSTRLNYLTIDYHHVFSKRPSALGLYLSYAMYEGIHVNHNVASVNLSAWSNERDEYYFGGLCFGYARPNHNWGVFHSKLGVQMGYGIHIYRYLHLQFAIRVLPGHFKKTDPLLAYYVKHYNMSCLNFAIGFSIPF
ncbi:MAG: hypothetical protein E3J72_08860 [Planctomycetota bacterium]|nr:MAG: hypothetical protein E3J72_08860 [Planctomycetota bacterium]